MIKSINRWFDNEHEPVVCSKYLILPMIFKGINILKSNTEFNYNQTYSYAIFTQDQVWQRIISYMFGRKSRLFNPELWLKFTSQPWTLKPFEMHIDGIHFNPKRFWLMWMPGTCHLNSTSLPCHQTPFFYLFWPIFSSLSNILFVKLLNPDGIVCVFFSVSLFMVATWRWRGGHCNNHISQNHLWKVCYFSSLKLHFKRF
jgi:hypothetical protein